MKKQKDKSDETHGLSGRFLFEITNNNSNSNTIKQPYFPPSKGVAKVFFHGHKIVPDFLKVHTKVDVQTVVDASKLTTDSSTLISCAVNVMRLSFNEALMFYHVMIKVRDQIETYARMQLCMYAMVYARLVVSYSKLIPSSG